MTVLRPVNAGAARVASKGEARARASRAVRAAGHPRAGGASPASAAALPPLPALRAAAAAVPIVAARAGPILKEESKLARRGDSLVARAAADVPAASAPAPSFTWVGAKPIPAAIAIGVGLFICFVVPRPEAVTLQAWRLLSIFVATIAGLVLEPLPVGAWAFLGMTTAVLTKTLTFAAATAEFSNEVIWLIVIAFFFAKGFVMTGLGDRVANLFVIWFGKSTLGLGYGLAISEAVISPAMPSTTARAGGVFLPIIKSLAKNAGSEPGPTADKMGAYLIQTQLQACAHSSAMWMTGAAQNLLTLKICADVTGFPLPSPFLTWLKASIVPTLAALLITPWLVFKLMPPTVQQTPEAPAEAQKRLEAMGPLSQNEYIMLGTMLLAVSLWMFGDKVGVSPVTTGMIALATLLITGVVKWQDCLQEKGAWDTLLWFAVLVGMSGQLSKLGFISWVSKSVANILATFNLGWAPVLLILNLAYFFVHYAFASQTAQVGAMVGAFVGVAAATGAPPILATLCFAFTTNIFGGINHYASGQSAAYYGAGYIDLPTFFRVGIICGVVSLATYIGLGAVWWKLMGFY